MNTNPIIMRDKVIEFIKKAKGLIISAKFTKRTNGELRIINCIYGVKNSKIPIKGVKRKFNPEEKGLITVYDTRKQEFRFINIDGLHWIKIRGIQYDVYD